MCPIFSGWLSAGCTTGVLLWAVHAVTSNWCRRPGSLLASGGLSGDIRLTLVDILSQWLPEGGRGRQPASAEQVAVRPSNWSGGWEGENPSKMTRVAGFHAVPVLLFLINDRFDTNPKASLAASGVLPWQSGFGPKRGMGTPLGCKRKRKRVLSHASVEAPTERGDYREAAGSPAPQPAGFMLCVPQDVERREWEAKVVAPSCLRQWLIQAERGRLLRDLLGTCPLSKMATTDGGLT